MNAVVDIVGLVREALQELGCADKVSDALNPHDPISVNFRDGSEIRIDAGQHGIHFVAPMPSVTESLLCHASTQMVEFAMRPPLPVFSPARPVIIWYDDHLALHANLAADGFSMPGFRHALEYFFEEAQALLQIVGKL